MTKRSPAFFLPEDPGASKDELRRRRVTRWHADATATATMVAARLEAEAGTLDMMGSVEPPPPLPQLCSDAKVSSILCCNRHFGGYRAETDIRATHKMLLSRARSGKR